MEEKQEVYEDAAAVQGDEMAVLSDEQLLDNLKNDVKAYTKANQTAKDDLENYKAQLDIDRQIWDIIGAPGAFKRITPTFEFEKNENYWKLQEQKQAYKLRMDKAMAEGTLKQHEMHVSDTEDALKRAESKLERFGGKNDE